MKRGTQSIDNPSTCAFSEAFRDDRYRGAPSWQQIVTEGAHRVCGSRESLPRGRIAATAFRFLGWGCAPAGPFGNGIPLSGVKTCSSRAAWERYFAFWDGPRRPRTPENEIPFSKSRSRTRLHPGKQNTVPTVPRAAVPAPLGCMARTNPTEGWPSESSAARRKGNFMQDESAPRGQR